MLSFTDEDLDGFLEGRAVFSHGRLRFLTRGWAAPSADDAPGEGAVVRVLVTASGHDDLTGALPRHADEVEEWLAPRLAAGAAR